MTPMFKKLPVAAVLAFALAGHVALTLPAMQYKGIDPLHEVILHVESGNRRYGADGELVTSKRGALGEMQVMPYTVADPGYGVTPAANDSPDEYARVGRDYFNALFREYDGDIRKSFAAYNAGPSKVDKAIQLAEKSGKPEKWLAYLPRETRRYVKAGMEKLQQKSSQTG